MVKYGGHGLALNIDNIKLIRNRNGALNNITTNKEFKDKKNLRLVYQPQDIFIKADRSRITQVITNLLNNAVKFTKGGAYLLP